MDVIDTAAAGPSVIRGSLMRLIGLVVGTLATIVSSAVIIRHLGVVDTGRFVTVMALVVIVGSISDLGLSAVGVREYSVRSPEAGQRLLRNLLGMRIAFVAAGLVVAVGFAAVADYTRTMVIGTLLAGVGMVIYVIQQSLTIPLQVRLRFGWVAGLQLLFQVGVAVEGALLALAGAHLLPFFALWIPILIPVVLLTAWVGGRETRVLPAVNREEWRGMLSQIVAYSAAVVLSVLYFRIVQIMVSLLSTDVETGYFGVAFRILETITTVPPLLVSSALPVLARAARDDHHRFDYAARRLAETMLLAGIGVALILFLGAHFAVELVAGTKFDASVGVVRILSFALIGTFLIAARGYALLSLGRLRAMMAANALALTIVLAAGIPLIRAHGATGGAIALMSAELSLALCYELALTHERPHLRLPFGFDARVVLAALVAAVPVLVLGLPSLVAAVVGALVYAVMLFALRLVPVEVLHALRPGTA